MQASNSLLLAFTLHQGEEGYDDAVVEVSYFCKTRYCICYAILVRFHLC